MLEEAVGSDALDTVVDAHAILGGKWDRLPHLPACSLAFKKARMKLFTKLNHVLNLV